MIKLKLIEPEEKIPQDKHLFNVSSRDFKKNMKIHRLDVETKVEDVWDLICPKDKKFDYPNTIQLPNNELLLFDTSWKNASIACIIDCWTLRIRKFVYLYLHNTRFRINIHYGGIHGAAYWKNSIYILGQFRRKWNPYLWNYNLLNGKNTMLATFPIKLHEFFDCSCICFEEKLILVSSFFDIYVYDFYSNSLSKAEEICNDRVYILIPGKTNLYYLSHRYIFESEYKNPYLWKIISEVNIEYGYCVKSWTCYNNSIYIRKTKFHSNNKREIDNIYYEFSLGKKSLERKTISKHNCLVF